MPFVFLIAGLGLLITAVRGTQATAFGLLKSEFSGINSFAKWALAIFILGGLGYIKTIQPITRGLMILVLLAIILKNRGGLFSSFNKQVSNPVQPAAQGTSGALQSTGQGGSLPTPDQVAVNPSIAPTQSQIAGAIPNFSQLPSANQNAIVNSPAIFQSFYNWMTGTVVNPQPTGN
jgi:hypothetical protein